MTTVLVVTTKLDPHADAVMDALDAEGCTSFRFHPEDFLLDYELSMGFGEDGWNAALRDSLGRELKFPGTNVVGYLRKPQSVGARPELTDPFHRRFAEAESRETIRGLLRLPGVEWFPDPDTIRRASVKLPQLEAARRAGLDIPDTLVTTSPRSALDFVAAHPEGVVCKRLGAAPVGDEQRHLVLFTSSVDAADLEALERNVVQAPTLLQAQVPKATELRVVLIGEELFACEIDSQGNERSSVDWRAVSPFELPHRLVTLPEKVQRGLRRFLEAFGAQFAVIDMAITPDGRYVFFENNPNGQWYWVELMTGAPLAKTVARFLRRLAEA